MAGIAMPIIASAELGDFLKVEQRMQKMADRVRRTSSSFKGLGSAITGAVSGAALIGLGKTALQEASDAYKVNQLTNTILKNTGASAYITGQQISALSGKLSVQAGIDDDLVQAGANVLLSFNNIRNVGKGTAAIFDRATAAAVDLGAKMGTEPVAAAKLLGRALADPTKAYRILRGAGVQLTNSQIDQIKVMQQRGDLIAAQSVIMQAVEGRVKGAAAAMATPMDRLNAAMQQILEQVGTPLLEAFSKLIERLAPHFDDVAKQAYKFGTVIVNVFKTLYRFRGLIINVATLLVAMWTYSKISAAAGAVIAVFQTVRKAILAVRAASVATAIAEAFATGGASLAAGAAGVVAAGAAVLVMNSQIGKLTAGMENVPEIAVPKFDDMTSGVDAAAASYSGLSAAIDAATQSGKDFATGAKKSSTAAKKASPKTTRARPAASTAPGMFTVAGSGGGISLSVTVNGSVVQERDIARTIRDEIIQLSRRQGVMPAFGV